jgi:hypothetical protein
MRDDILRQAFEVFRTDAEAVPPLTLRGGDAVDRYDEPPAYDPAVDEPTDAYLEKYTFNGITYLDAASWRHYLPRLIDYALRQPGHSRTMAIEGVLSSLRPPDREPPRLTTLTAEQEVVIVAFLEHLAFSDHAIPGRDLALQVLEEWWLPNARYRHRTERPSGTPWPT